MAPDLLLRLRRLLVIVPGLRRRRSDDREDEQDAQRAVLRAIELSLRIGERLLSAGQGAADVEAAMRAVLNAYGLPGCEPLVAFTTVSVSRQVGPLGAPLTVQRTVRHRSPDYDRLMAVYRLIGEVAAGMLDAEDAARRLDVIDAARAPYPGWVLALAPGLLAASASLLVTARVDAKGLITFAVAFIAAAAGSRLATALARIGLSDFYLSAVAAMPAAAAGVGMALTGAGLGGSAVVTGSLFALFPGRTLVGAIEDGLTSFYLTAVTRLMEVLYLVAGIILGVLTLLPAGVRLGAQFAPEGGLERGLSASIQIPAAALLAAALAVTVRTPRRIVPLNALGGALAWTVFDLLAGPWGVNPVVATGAGGFAAAFFGQATGGFRHVSPLPYTTGALCPLLPGSLLYTGLLSLGQGKIVGGVGDLSRAAATALALAVGVGIATEAARIGRARVDHTRP